MCKIDFWWLLITNSSSSIYFQLSLHLFLILTKSKWWRFSFLNIYKDIKISFPFLWRVPLDPRLFWCLMLSCCFYIFSQFHKSWNLISTKKNSTMIPPIYLYIFLPICFEWSLLQVFSYKVWKSSAFAHFIADKPDYCWTSQMLMIAHI